MGGARPGRRSAAARARRAPGGHGPSQPAVPLIPAFSTGAFVPAEGLGVTVQRVFDQVIPWSGALRGLRRAPSKAHAVVR